VFVRRVWCRLLWLPCLLWVSGCSLLTKWERPAPLANSLQEIVPHSDRDHFVYVWRRIEDGRVTAAGVQVEHVSAIKGGEFEVTLSENGTAMGRMRFRDEGRTLVLLREDDLSRGVRFTYDPPLAQLQVPLFPGRQQVSASATMARSADGETIAVVPVTQVVEAQPGAAVRSRVGDYRSSVVIRTARTLHLPDEVSEMQAETVVVPGIGEIRSTGSVSDTQVLHRELACAIIGGRRIGDCTNLNKSWEENNDAGPSDVR
jgi:hypothetical protein